MLPRVRSAYTYVAFPLLLYEMLWEAVYRDFCDVYGGYIYELYKFYALVIVGVAFN